MPKNAKNIATTNYQNPKRLVQSITLIGFYDLLHWAVVVSLVLGDLADRQKLSLMCNFDMKDRKKLI